MIIPYKKADITFSEMREMKEQGCFSRVYLAYDENLAHELIIKEIKKEKEKSRDEFFSEARLLYKYAHPNIVQVQYAAEDNDNIYIAMPFYHNGTINQLLEKKNLTPRELIRYGIQFIGGLHHIHTQKLMHFDIKPNNIMLSNRNEAMLSDFGLAKLVNNSLKAIPDLAYKFHIPPEYFTSAKEGFNYTYDIYQTGLTLYRMAVGYVRFKKERDVFKTNDQLKNSIISGEFPQKKYPSHIPKKLINIIDKCLELEPNNRYQAALDILNDLSAIQETDGPLDWREVENNKDNIYEWHKDTKDAKLQLTYNIDNKESICYRIDSVGTKRKYSKACNNNCTERKLYSILKEC